MNHKIENISIIRQILSGAQTGLWTIELEENKPPRMFADETMLHLLGLTEFPGPEPCYQAWYSRIDPSYYDIVNKTVQEIIHTGHAESRYPWNHPERGQIYIRCGGVCDHSQTSILTLSGYHQDVTEVIQIEKEKAWLEQLNADITSSLGNLYDAFYRLNSKDKTVLILRALDDLKELEVTSISFDQFFHAIKQVFHPEDFAKFKETLCPEHIRKPSENPGKYCTAEYRRLTSDGSFRWYSIVIFSDLKTKSENCTIVALKDIHERKAREERAERALREAYETATRANEAKSVFLSRMSHDIRTPINAIIGMTTLAQTYIDQKDRVLDYLDKISSSSHMLLELVNGILDMSKIESGQYQMNLKSFLLPELLTEIKHIYDSIMLQNEQTFLIQYDILQHPHVIGDKDHLKRIITNLLSNAVKYTPAHGQITVTVKELPSHIPHYGHYQFTVQDTGIGINDNHIKTVFEPFSRADDSRTDRIPGVGLGLTITKNLVQMAGGTIEVHSKPGEGTCFTVNMDLKIAEESMSSDPDAKPESKVDLMSLSLPERHFLLVEDNDLNQEIACELLSMTGAHITIANNGEEAINIFSASPLHYFDLIFMDIQMPVMNGYEAARTIRSMPREDALTVPIIAMTANTFTEDIVQAQQAGMNEHLAKPIDVVLVAEVIQKYL